MRFVAALVGAMLTFAALPLRADDLKVSVASGTLVGFLSRDGAVRSFKGIPYAAPPVGALRWRPPQDMAAWEGTREATRFGPACPQPSPIPGSLYQREFFQSSEPQSEDCLTLNIWTAAASGPDRRPVIVFLPGGAYYGWSGSMAAYDGTHLARKGAVVVTINYRLGALGFLAHPELDEESPNHVSGNYGVLDQQAALRWVKSNIAAFGGDPERITLLGHSAGAGSAGYAMASPLAKGLFRRAIVLSGSLFGTAGPTPDLAFAEQGGKKLAAELGAPSIAALREMPAARLVAHIGRNAGAYGLRPVLDGWVLPKDTPQVLAAGEQNGDEVILGSVADEGTALLPATTPARLQATIKQWFGSQADPIAALYAAADDKAATAAQDHLLSDYGAAMARMAASLSAQHGHPAWVYRFNRAAPGSDPVEVGAFHGAELVYVFGTLNTVDRPWEEADRRLADTISSYCVRFAMTGNPNGPGLPDWPPYDETSRYVAELGGPGDAASARSAPLMEAYLKARLTSLGR
ncbi:MAG: carboxylesterase family protein [Acetobacteraceae bacterium]|nr:carboxylesterase family protein [Acetobacteraceae bacterium]